MLPSSAEPWIKLRDSPFAQDVLGLPVEVACSRSGSRMYSQLRKSLLWSADFDQIATRDTQMGFSVTSPLYTLFTMARSVGFWDLVLAMYEACGWFAVFELPKSVREEAIVWLKRQHEQKPDGREALDVDSYDDHPWRCCFAKAGSRKGEPTSLWQRPPLIDVSELHNFAERMRQRRWGDTFFKAAMLVRGIAASPLEVQGYLLLAAPRSMGGAGLDDALLNDWTPLSADAKKLCSNNVCYGDIVIANERSKKTVVVECQGEMIHGTGAIQASDADRVAALQSMGCCVLLVSHDMLNDSEQFRIIVKTICRESGIKFRRKSTRQLASESALRSSVFCNWADLV